jgi:hypothetical protein
LINFEILALRICILGDVFRININEFWFWVHFLCLFKLVFIGGRQGQFLYLRDHSSMILFAGAAFFIFGVLFIENHCFEYRL